MGASRTGTARTSRIPRFNLLRYGGLSAALVAGVYLFLDRTGGFARGEPAAGDPARGAALYAQHCAGCHGAEGRGDGVAAEFVYPRPRDFAAAEFRVVSAPGGLPTSEDLLQVITDGMPGSVMPSWGFLPEADRLALAAHVKTLVRYYDEDAEEWVNLYEDRGEPVAVACGEPPPSTPERVARGRMLFARAGCVDCHGAAGRGDGPTAGTIVDAAGGPVLPRDLTEGVFKGGNRPEDVFRRITCGMGPMPGYEASQTSDERWDLAHYVLSLSSPSAQDLAAQRSRTVRARRAGAAIPDDPRDPAWDAVEPVYVSLMPLWWRRERVSGLLVRALHDGTDLVVHLRWEDPTENGSAIRPQDYRDGAAVQWALEEGIPFLAMGDARAKVNLWFWRSDREGGPERYPDVEGTYPNRVVDDYPSLREWQPGEGFAAQGRPAREHDPRFLTGWGAGNPVSDPGVDRPVECLEAQGPSTVATRGPRAQIVGGRGAWDKGAWSVVFRRALRAGRGEVDLSPGRRVPLAFAVFDGAQGDRDGQKSITIWHDLEVER